MMKKNTTIIQVQVVLGNPKIKCDGYGICKITTKDTVFPSCHPEQTVVAHILGRNNALFILFNKQSLSKTIYDTYFKNGIFRIDTSFALPDWLTGALGLPPSVLALGNYPIQHNKDSFFIYSSFKLNHERLHQSMTNGNTYIDYSL
jgi:hypothetical protein